jgi:hypothetical protein
MVERGMPIESNRKSRMKLPRLSCDLMALVVLSALLGGCARGLLQPPAVIPEGERALVTFTRESTMVGAAWSYTVVIDGQQVAAMRSGDQYTIAVAAGWHDIGLLCPFPRSLGEQLQAGKQYYFRIGPPPFPWDCPTIRQVAGADLPPAKLKLDHATPADVELRLFGKGGLVPGPRRFEAEFERMVLTGDDAWRLRTFIKDALVAPPGSELRFKGTINTKKFKAKMEKDKKGLAEVEFEGLAFQNEAEMEDFLAPFAREDVEELQFDGSVGDRPVKIKRKPNAPSAAKGSGEGSK